jgi:hypothetical protein
MKTTIKLTDQVVSKIQNSLLIFYFPIIGFYHNQLLFQRIIRKSTTSYIGK